MDHCHIQTQININKKGVKGRGRETKKVKKRNRTIPIKELRGGAARECQAPLMDNANPPFASSNPDLITHQQKKP